jgi:hypothetical protein
MQPILLIHICRLSALSRRLKQLHVRKVCALQNPTTEYGLFGIELRIVQRETLSICRCNCVANWVDLDRYPRLLPSPL